MGNAGQGGGGRIPTTPIAPLTGPARPALIVPDEFDPPSGVSPTVPAPANALGQAEGAFTPPHSTRDPLPRVCSACGERYPSDFMVCPRDASPLTTDGNESAEDPLVGRVIGETYKIGRVIGEGGMGRVYEAKHLRLGDRRLAIKILHAELARDPEIVLRFQREAESASAIDHPHVIDVFDVHKTADGRPYLVGEFLEGQELGEHILKVGRLDVSTAATIARQICRALNAAHARGIVHRDMKPENVFITSRDGMPHIKVIDFGISKAQKRDTNLTRTGLIMGTPSYMAPEQARGDKVDHRVDVYAVGALLYTALTGKKPFDNDDPTTILGMVLTSEPVRPRAIDPMIPEGLEVVVQRAMAKDPRDRYQTMVDLGEALAPFELANAPQSEAMQSILKRGNGTIVSPSAGGSGGGGLRLDGFEAGARTMMAASGTSQERDAREARLARPLIIGFSLAIAVWFVGGFVGALGGTVRWVRGGDLTITESILLVLGSGFLAMTPAVLFALHVKKSVWPNSVRALELAADLRRTAAIALVTYGAASIVTRILYTVLLRHADELASGGWDALLFVASFLGALIAGGVGPVARFFRRKANA
jgi:serine/threonine-protein kinase